MIAAVVLAAGAATRFGSAKQLLLLPAVLERLEGAELDEIVVVAGAYALEEGTLALGSARVVRCLDWARGPGASLRCGLAALPPETEAALVVLADGPSLDPRAVARLLAHRSEADVLAASYGGVRGHPALFSRRVWSAIPDEGGRSLEALLVACDDLTPPGDVDTPEQLSRRYS